MKGRMLLALWSRLCCSQSNFLSSPRRRDERRVETFRGTDRAGLLLVWGEWGEKSCGGSPCKFAAPGSPRCLRARPYPFFLLHPSLRSCSPAAVMSAHGQNGLTDSKTAEFSGSRFSISQKLAVNAENRLASRS